METMAARSRSAGGGAAFTLVEVLMVAGLVSGIVLGAVFYHVTGQRQSTALDFQAAALQSAQLVVGHLQQDLSNLQPGVLSGTYAAPTPSQGVDLTRVVERSGARGLPLDAQDAPLVESVAWRFDPATHLLYRNGEPIRGAPLESVEFTFFPCRPDDPTPPYGDTLVVRLVAVPLEALGRATAQTPRAVFTAAFHSSQGTVNHLHEDWVGDR
ncbi:MAG: hypothetical protein HY815_31020 [Candidatus Riflebacteria bacterium]|nr:hypothetical protein [Candidatus Riflebacteria bacterium]